MSSLFVHMSRAELYALMLGAAPAIVRKQATPIKIDRVCWYTWSGLMRYTVELWEMK